MQVWRKSDGTMIYERKLINPPKGWGLYMDQQDSSESNGSPAMNMFFYQENRDGQDFFEPIICITYGRNKS